MKILLFNDNPVVRKLVALSAQKTKDDLSVIWSVDEIEGSEYDLLIVDDALYSDEMFESLNEKIIVKSTLFMATRGQAVPSGFDNVINKPFLPTDLVDMFVQIEKKVSAAPEAKSDAKDESTSAGAMYAINLEDTLPDLEGHEEELMEAEYSNVGEDEFDLSSLEDFDEKLPETAILDQDEVQEVQGLLEETEESPLPLETEDDFSFDDDLVPQEIEGEILNFDNVLEDDRSVQEDTLAHNELLDEDDFDDIEFSASLVESTEADEDDEFLSISEENPSDEENNLDEMDISALMEEDELLPMGEETLSDDEGSLDEMDLDTLMDDDELGDLESKIEDAVSTLEEDELEQELESDDFGLDFDDSGLDELTAHQEESTEKERAELEDFDELDMLDERELKRAIGEEIEDDEPVVYTDEGDMSLAAETLDEVMNESSPFFEEIDEESEEVDTASHAEGVEALQALLKALSNENVAKSLKGMNISININFGNDK